MAKSISPKLIKKIKSLRTKGYSLSEIKNEVKAGYGTIFRYIRGVKISAKHINSWFGKRGGSRKRKIQAEIIAKEKSKNTIISLSKNERVIFMSALYWGEGSKGDFGLSNTDPNLIRIFVKGLTKILGISKNRLKISIRIYEDMNKEKCLAFWSEIVGIPVEKFINVNVLQGKKKGKLEYGMCRVRVEKGGDLLKYMTALKTRIVELF